jgi:small subunit ribosomal protein S3
MENVQVEVNEIENPWLDAAVMASRLARQLERGVRFRRMAYWIIRRVMRAGAIGCEIIVKGKLSSRRARYQKFKQGTIAKTGEPSDAFVDEADDRAVLKPGVIGIKVLIMRPDAKLPGVINIKPPKPKKPEEIELIKKPEEEKVSEEEEVMEEALEGITNIDELRELEELDGLELVDDITTPDEPELKTEESDEATDKATDEDEQKTDEDVTEMIDEDLSELDSLDEEDAK